MECGCCVVPLHVHFRLGVTLVEEFNYWALLTSSWENNFQVPEVLRARGHIQGPGDERKAKSGLVFVLCKLWEENPVFV